MTDYEQWKAFAARVTLTFPFRVDLEVEPCDDGRVSVAVQLHVPERDTREPITVRTRRHARWENEQDAVDVIKDLLETALKHEIHESVRVDGKLALDTHAPHAT